jgi:putative SOS response-associated peptidase YedK
MCGRYVLVHDPTVIAAEFDAELDSELVGREFKPNYNVAPSVHIPVITLVAGTRVLTQARWGILPKWSRKASTLLINARGESVIEKVTFTKAFATHRILIPATAYYEWKRPAKDPYLISPPLGDPHPMALAGLIVESMIDGQAQSTCAIITLAAQPNLESIHDRMPACIAASHWGAWLDPEFDVEFARELLLARIDLRAFRVDRAVNSVGNNSPALIKELDSTD